MGLLPGGRGYNCCENLRHDEGGFLRGPTHVLSTGRVGLYGILPRQGAMDKKREGPSSGVQRVPAKVIDLDKWRLEHSPHLAGRGYCQNCKHEWEAAVPVGIFALTCPACNLSHGVLKSAPTPELAWSCATCNCVHFYIHPGGTMCANCGAQQLFD